LSAILVLRAAPFLRSNIPQTATATLDTYDFLQFRWHICCSVYLGFIIYSMWNNAFYSNYYWYGGLLKILLVVLGHQFNKKTQPTWVAFHSDFKNMLQLMFPIPIFYRIFQKKSYWSNFFSKNSIKNLLEKYLFIYLFFNLFIFEKFEKSVDTIKLKKY
jgi:hypothetical protein